MLMEKTINAMKARRNFGQLLELYFPLTCSLPLYIGFPRAYPQYVGGKLNLDGKQDILYIVFK